MLIDCSGGYQRQIKIPWTKKLQGYQTKKSGTDFQPALLIFISRRYQTQPDNEENKESYYLAKI